MKTDELRNRVLKAMRQDVFVSASAIARKSGLHSYQVENILAGLYLTGQIEKSLEGAFRKTKEEKKP